jgi:hypothetical protein
LDFLELRFIGCAKGVKGVDLTETEVPGMKRFMPFGDWHPVALLAIVLAFVLIQALASPAQRFWAWNGVMALLGLFALIAGHAVTGLWLGVLIDTRNKVSLARFQMLLWTILILSGFLTAVMVNIDLVQPQPLAVAIPPELWLLMGISTTSLIGSPLIISAKKSRAVKEEEKVRALRALIRQAVDTSKVTILGQLVVNETPEAAHWTDMFRGTETGNIGQLDLGKVQMFFFTLILVLAYGSALTTLFQSGKGAISALPTVDGGMLALLGISHAGYLLNKALPHSDST